MDDFFLEFTKQHRPTQSRSDALRTQKDLPPSILPHLLTVTTRSVKLYSLVKGVNLGAFNVIASLLQTSATSP